MDDGSDDTWIPPRPPADEAVWEARERAAASVSNPSVTTADPEFDETFDPPAGRIARSRASRRKTSRVRIGLGRRVLLSYLALVAVIVGVTGIGAALQPTYGSLSPWQGIRVDDLRHSPGRSAWAVDLASALAPGAPPECLRYSGVDVGQDLVALRVDAAPLFGLPDDSLCSAVPDGLGSRLILMDASTGAIRWVHDVTPDFTRDVGITVTSISPVDHDSRLLVRAVAPSESVIESVSVATGEELDSTGPMPWTQEDRFVSSGSVVATGSLSIDDLTYVYRLRSVNDLSRVLWNGTGNETATMIALSDRLLLGATGTLQIPLATGRASPWGGPVDTTLGYAVHGDTVFAQNTTGDGVTTLASSGFRALDRSGRLLWKSDLTLRGSSSITRSCLAATDSTGARLTCLDYRTGKALWTHAIGSAAYVSGAPGQRSDDVFLVPTSGQARVVALDGATGRQRFSETVPAGSRVVAAGHTVGYALAYGISGSQSNVTAIDLATGRRLWSHSAEVQLSIWGGHLIDVGIDGLARRLVG